MEKDSIKRMDADNLHNVGQTNAKQVVDQFVNVGTPVTPLVQDSSLDRGLQPTGTALLREKLANPNKDNATD
jgi:hypothetical protein